LKKSKSGPDDSLITDLKSKPETPMIRLVAEKQWDFQTKV